MRIVPRLRFLTPPTACDGCEVACASVLTQEKPRNNIKTRESVNYLSFSQLISFKTENVCVNYNV